MGGEENFTEGNIAGHQRGGTRDSEKTARCTAAPLNR